MSQAVFGRIIHGGQVEDAVRRTLRIWLSTYLADAEEQWGLDKGTIARPRTWVRTVSPLELHSSQLPVVAIQNAGSLGEPTRTADDDGRMVLGMSEEIDVAIFTKGIDVDDSLDNARMMFAAVRSTIEGK